MRRRSRSNSFCSGRESIVRRGALFDCLSPCAFNLQDYRRWKQAGAAAAGGGAFSFCAHAFVYDPAAKSRLLQLETQGRMMREFETAVMRSVFDQSCPYCVVRVRRQRLISDALREVGRQAQDLRKPLKARQAWRSYPLAARARTPRDSRSYPPSPTFGERSSSPSRPTSPPPPPCA